MANSNPDWNEQDLFFNQPDAIADFAHWAKMATWTLEQGIALSLGKCPRIVNSRSLNGNDQRYVLRDLLVSPFRREYGLRLELVNSAKSANDLDDPIRPELFLEWALDRFDPIAPELVDRVKAQGKRIADRQSLASERDNLRVRVTELESEAARACTSKWPWGDHETAYLRAMEKAAREWQGYDPSGPNSAPKSEGIVDLLRQEKNAKGVQISANIAKAIATIVRHDKAPDGPRKRKGLTHN